MFTAEICLIAKKIKTIPVFFIIYTFPQIIRICNENRRKKKRRKLDVKAEKIVTRHDGYTSIKYRYSRKPYVADTFNCFDIEGTKAEVRDADVLYRTVDPGEPDHHKPQEACILPGLEGLPDDDDLPFIDSPSGIGSRICYEPSEYVSRAFCPFCGNVTEERWGKKEHHESRGIRSYVTRKCACGHDIDMIVPSLDRFRKEEEKFNSGRRCKDEEMEERYEALQDADLRVKYGSLRMTYINLFDEKYDKVTAMIGYTVTCISRKTGTPVPLNGSAKVIMNMKTGMTYIKNGRFFKKDCPEIVRLFYTNGLKSICYGMPSWISYGIIKRVYGQMIIDALEEPEVVRHFAENIIRYKGLDKGSLTQAGDFSDTLFAMVCIANNSPGYTFRSYAVMAHMKDFAVKRRIKRLKADMGKGEVFMAKKYFKDMPKSLRKIIAKDPFYYYLFKDLRNVGFTDPNVMKKIAGEKPVQIAGAMIYISEEGSEQMQQFVKEYISRYGEKKAVKMLCSMKPDGKYIVSEDFRIFHDADKLFNAFVKENAVPEADMSGKTIKEIHDSLSSSYYRLKCPDSKLVYKNGEEKYEKTVDDYKFRLPETRYELADTGRKMHNCVAVYGDHIEAGICTIVTAVKGSRFEMCIEIRDNTVVQAKGNCNEELTEKQRGVLKRWAGENGLAVGDHL